MSEAILEFVGVSKRFFGTPVLKDVRFALAPGQVLGLVGENGAGKSTLMNILGGVLQPDGGEMRLAGRPYAPRDPLEAAAAGVALVHQELNLFGNLSIAENLFLADLPHRQAGPFRWVNRRALRQQAAALLAAVRLAADPDAPVETLSPGERQLVEIARALKAGARIVVFDEPTTSLSNAEVQRLFEIIDRLRADGVSIIYISHSLGDVQRLCDQVVVLRDGEVQAVGPRTEFTTARMIALMVGRSLDTLYPRREAPPTNQAVLEVRGLTQTGVAENIGFTLHAGEVLGVLGLMGSGRTELARMLFGLDPFERGEIRVHGGPLGRPSPRRCVARGMGFLTEDRAAEGLMLDASIAENVVLASLSAYTGPAGLLRHGRAREKAAALARTLRIEHRSLAQPVRTLSGGNQQKVVLAKWLAGGVDVLIVDEPTRGVDVGAKYEIYQQINALAAKGAGILWISSEIEELMGLCDRILVLCRGEVGAVAGKSAFDRDALLRAALGEERLQ